MSKSTIGRIRKAFEPKPHRADGFKLSNDPRFLEKVYGLGGALPEPAGIGRGAERGREVTGPGAGPITASVPDDARHQTSATGSKAWNESPILHLDQDCRTDPGINRTTPEADFRRRTLAGHYQSGPRLRGGDFAQQSRAALRRVACQASALSPDQFPEFMRATSQCFGVLLHVFKREAS